MEKIKNIDYLVISTYKDIVKVKKLNFVYHITKKTNLNSIIKEGLKPTRSYWGASTPELGKARKSVKFKKLIFFCT